MGNVMRLGILLFIGAVCSLGAVDKLVWPTPSTAYIDFRPIEEWVQPTSSGKPESGLYGCTRTNGYQFHEGLDIAPQSRTSRGVALDKIYAAMAGKVLYVNHKSGYSSYGKYIIIEHGEAGLRYTSLYAHMASIEKNIRPGVMVRTGQTLGIMGNTAASGIPVSRSHLHLEFDLQLTNNFQSWYNSQKYGQKNRHGNYNGFNFIGWNPVAFYNVYRKGKLQSVAHFLKAHPTAVVAVVRTNKVPWFIRRNTALLSAAIPAQGVKGWQIEFSDVGIPKSWTPLTEAPRQRLALLDGPIEPAKCRKLKKDETTPGKNLKGILEMLFGEEF